VEQAQSFTPSESGYLSDIYLGLVKVINLNQCQVKLAMDQGGFPSQNDVVETWVLDTLPLVGSGEKIELVSALHPFLNAGQNYWIWISVNEGSSAAWGQNVTGAIGHMAQRQFEYELHWVDEGNDNQFGAMRVEVINYVGLNDLTSAPTQVFLHQNFPNPFNQSTSITFELPKNELVSLDIFDHSGRLVRTLIENYCTAGVHQVQWNGENNEGVKEPGGIFIYCMKTKDGITRSHQMVLIK
jgi:hypothetical protein